MNEDFDIMLIKTAAEINFTRDFVSPICLPNPRLNFNQVS